MTRYPLVSIADALTPAQKEVVSASFGGIAWDRVPRNPSRELAYDVLSQVCHAPIARRGSWMCAQLVLGWTRYQYSLALDLLAYRERVGAEWILYRAGRGWLLSPNCSSVYLRQRAGLL